MVVAVAGAGWQLYESAAGGDSSADVWLTLAVVAFNLFPTLTGAASLALILVALAAILGGLDAAAGRSDVASTSSAPDRHRVLLSPLSLKLAAAVLLVLWSTMPAWPNLILAMLRSDAHDLFVVVGDGSWGVQIRAVLVGSGVALILTSLAAALTRLDRIASARTETVE